MNRPLPSTTPSPQPWSPGVGHNVGQPLAPIGPQAWTPGVGHGVVQGPPPQTTFRRPSPVVNVPPIQVIPVSGPLQLAAVANLTGANLPGVENVVEGGALNAFIDAAASILESADAQGVSLELGGRAIQSWYRDNDRDPNPIAAGAVGAEMGDRIYVETVDGWCFAIWSGIWYAIPMGKTPIDFPCESPRFTGCALGRWALGLNPGDLPGDMIWRAGANPDMNPAGEIFAEDELPGDATIRPLPAGPGRDFPVALALAAAAALYFLR